MERTLQRLQEKANEAMNQDHVKSIDTHSYINSSSRSLFINTMKDKDFSKLSGKSRKRKENASSQLDTRDNASP